MNPADLIRATRYCPDCGIPIVTRCPWVTSDLTAEYDQKLAVHRDRDGCEARP